ncbi:hypothetical protein DFJ58DRAFT_847777 [Suillus subalutaceus]|uniref:uncharacterized protein n=1 Tax=Suillus subalutaceus TaxID=48586 RepID=UPI001B870787|nr:uncharacterized protein DFJ58DRAFT_847777 [Suillus subalutaceus]KAG1833623.1 hypothetical protein DFJ58DRAFT_847777 [Suillus subalutaceus]
MAALQVVGKYYALTDDNEVCRIAIIMCPEKKWHLIFCLLQLPWLTLSRLFQVAVFRSTTSSMVLVRNLQSSDGCGIMVQHTSHERSRCCHINHANEDGKGQRPPQAAVLSGNKGSFRPSFFVMGNWAERPFILQSLPWLQVTAVIVSLRFSAPQPDFPTFTICSVGSGVPNLPDLGQTRYEFVSSIPPSGPACSQGTDPFTPYTSSYLDHPPPPLVSPALTHTIAQQTTIGSPAFTIKYVHHLGDLLGMMPGITAVKVFAIFMLTDNTMTGSQPKLASLWK